MERRSSLKQGAGWEQRVGLGSPGAQSGQPRNTPVGGLVTFTPRPASRLLDIVRENQEVNVEEAINISELQQSTSLFFYKAFILLLKLFFFS